MKNADVKVFKGSVVMIFIILALGLILRFIDIYIYDFIPDVIPNLPN